MSINDYFALSKILNVAAIVVDILAILAILFLIYAQKYIKISKETRNAFLITAVLLVIVLNVCAWGFPEAIINTYFKN